MEPKIIFSDSSLAVLDKPAGWVVNRAESVKQETIQDWVEKELFKGEITKSMDEEFINRSGVVHRLDKETSGILLASLNPQSFKNLQSQFHDRKVKKRYLTLVHGSVTADSGIIDTPLGRLPWSRERFGILEEGREAQTEYKVIKRFTMQVDQKTFNRHPGKDFGYTLLEAYPKTGRTHQIRVHLKSIGHPVVSDEFYAGRKTARDDRSWNPRLFLHANKIGFFHPDSNAWIEFESPLPEDLVHALKRLSESNTI
jgi:23S rRNA pseudouridine1911/1915/1917 synthase